MTQNVVQKQLICLEDLQLGTGVVVQDRNGIAYTLHRLDVVPSVASVEELQLIEGYERARVGLVNYTKALGSWAIDPIPLEAFAALGTAASRGVTGPGDLLHKGFAGVGGPAAAGAVSLALGLQATIANSTAAGAPVDELCAILTLPGATANLVQFAVSTVTGNFYVRRVGAMWKQVALVGDSVEFNALKAESVRANSVGTPKD
jgi:hypothetical protein